MMGLVKVDEGLTIGGPNRLASGIPGVPGLGRPWDSRQS